VSKRLNATAVHVKCIAVTDFDTAPCMCERFGLPSEMIMVRQRNLANSLWWT